MLNFTRKQQGFIKLKAVFAILIIAIMFTLLAVYYHNQEVKKDNSIEYGSQIVQYTSAVRVALVADGANIFTAGATKTGANWLKANDGTCPGGTASHPFIMCAFVPELYGANINTIGISIVSNGDPRSPTFSSVILFPGITDPDGKAIDDLSEITYQSIIKNSDHDRSLSFSNGVIEYKLFKMAGAFLNTSTGTSVSVSANTIVAFVASAVADNNKPDEGSVSSTTKAENNSAANYYVGMSSSPSSGSSLLNNPTMSSLTAAGAASLTKIGSNDGAVQAVSAAGLIGGDCAPDGSVLKDASGKQLICISSVWKERSDQQIYTCPSFTYTDQPPCETSFSTCTGELSANPTCWYLGANCKVNVLSCSKTD